MIMSILYFLYVMAAIILFSTVFLSYVFFFKQKTAYEMRISDWSSDVCSSDLSTRHCPGAYPRQQRGRGRRRLPVPRRAHHDPAAHAPREIGRASCRERVCQYV